MQEEIKKLILKKSARILKTSGTELRLALAVQETIILGVVATAGIIEVEVVMVVLEVSVEVEISEINPGILSETATVTMGVEAGTVTSAEVTAEAHVAGAAETLAEIIITETTTETTTSAMAAETEDEISEETTIVGTTEIGIEVGVAAVTETEAEIETGAISETTGEGTMTATAIETVITTIMVEVIMEDSIDPCKITTTEMIGEIEEIEMTEEIETEIGTPVVIEEIIICMVVFHQEEWGVTIQVVMEVVWVVTILAGSECMEVEVEVEVLQVLWVVIIMGLCKCPKVEDIKLIYLR